jgi:hypothetical protein
LNRFALLVVAACCAAFASPSSAVAGPTYFLVAETPRSDPHGDSFVVGIETPADVAHARAPGADGLNRDLLAAGKPAWDWHVTQVTGFGDFGIELLDGWPTFVNDDVDGWMKNTGGPGGQGGKIGFWSYTVVRELPNYADGGGTPPAVPLPPAALIGAATMAMVGARRWLAARGATTA